MQAEPMQTSIPLTNVSSSYSQADQGREILEDILRKGCEVGLSQLPCIDGMRRAQQRRHTLS